MRERIWATAWRFDEGHELIGAAGRGIPGQSRPWSKSWRINEIKEGEVLE